jgi:hypothetical protein
VVSGGVGRLDGEWFGRWQRGTFGYAEIQVIGDRLYTIYSDVRGRLRGRTWLLEAAITDGRYLASRWVQVGRPSDTGPFVGLIVNDERIDGIWHPRGDRWDFRRAVR